MSDTLKGIDMNKPMTFKELFEEVKKYFKNAKFDKKWKTISFFESKRDWWDIYFCDDKKDKNYNTYFFRKSVYYSNSKRWIDNKRFKDPNKILELIKCLKSIEEL